MSASDSLYAVQTNTFKNIPRELFEDSADEFLKGDAIDRLYQFDDLYSQSPFSMVFELQDEDGKICGVFWFVIDPVLSAVYGRFISVLPEYRDGKIIQRATELGNIVANEIGLKYLFAATQKNTNYWQQFGWKVANTKTLYQEVK